MELAANNNEMDFDPEQYKGFNEFVTEAKRVYLTNQRPKFLAWVKKAIVHFESQREQLPKNSEVQVIEENNKFFNNEISFLQRLLK